MLSGDNSILQRATDAKVKTEKAQIIEKAQTDILGQQAENKGTNITKGQLAKILNTYFKPTAETSIPDEISTTNDLVLTTIDDKYNINLSQIYTGPFEVGQAKWSYNHDTQTVTNGTLTLSIGDYVNDTETTVTGFDGKWRVLGEENGQLLLISASILNSAIRLEKTDSIDTWIEKFDNAGKVYADEIKTEKGRCATINDINRITGYNPMEARVDSRDLTKKETFGKDAVSQFGNNVTYMLKEDGKVWYKGDKAVTSEQQSNYTQFWPIGESKNITEPYKIQSGYYYYFPETLGTFPGTAVNNGQVMEGISTDSPAYDAIFKTPKKYYLASPCIAAGAGVIHVNLFYIDPSPGVVQADCGSFAMWRSDYGPNYGIFEIRSVVRLKPNVIPQFVSKDSSSNISTYEI